MNKIQKIKFNKKTDNRGSLVPIESYKDVPFNIERIFYIKNMDELPRGFHSHKKTIQVIVPIMGSFEIELTDGINTSTFLLDEDNIGLLIPINIWVKMFNFSKDCIIFVICSYKYDETEYVRDFNDFLKEGKEGKENNIIKTFDLQEQTTSIKNELFLKINDIIDKNEYVLGNELRLFEESFSKYNNIKYCVGVSNGTSALVSALLALELNSNDEVIVQSNTYIAAPLAIHMANLKIKIVDVDDTIIFDLEKLESNITEKTKVVIVVHLYGTCPDMDKLLELKNKYNFYLIEDAAQAHGSSFNGKNLGTFGDIGCFSFYPSKNLGSFGEGGCIITNNEKYYDYIKKYRNYGSVEKYKWEIKGTNERLHNIQAGILNVKLKYLDEWNNKRNEIAKIYDTELSTIEQIIIPKNHKKLYRNYHLYVILVENRDNLVKYLKNNNIGCDIHYPETFYKSNAFKEFNHLNFNSDLLKNKLVSLPLYPEILKDDIIKICQKINTFYKI